jgi:hypothetical protein
MDDNYKFSRKFELGVLGEEICEFINKTFVAKKVALPADADMKVAKNRARIEIWSPTNKKIGELGTENDSLLNKSPFTSYLKVRAAKSEKIVKDEIARVQKLRKEAAAKKETAKAGE